MFLVIENLHQVVLAENILNNKTTYIHKNLFRKIPQKSLEKYAICQNMLKEEELTMNFGTS